MDTKPKKRKTSQEYIALAETALRAAKRNHYAGDQHAGAEAGVYATLALAAATQEHTVVLRDRA